MSSNSIETQNPRVVVTDHLFEDLSIERGILELLDCNIVDAQCRDEEALCELVAGADHVIIKFASVTNKVIEAMDKASVMVRYGIGVDNIDLDSARERGIPVVNVPDYCIDEVADHTLSLILATTRRLVAHIEKTKSGGWGLVTAVDTFRALRDATVGLVGFGRIGREVASRLKAFGARVIVSDPAIDPSVITNAGCEAASSLDQIWSECEIVSLHCPSTDSTRGMIYDESIARMKKGAILINVGRGDLVDEGALHTALDSGHLSAAALDVTDPEPIDPKSPLLERDDVIITPHVASVSPKAARRLRESVARAVVEELEGKPLSNRVV